jgi:hypothetical protein
LKIKFKYYENFIQDFYDNNINYFKDSSMQYNTFPKHIRTNFVLENCNGYLERQLGKHKEINYMDFLNFLLNEEERIYNIISK